MQNGATVAGDVREAAAAISWRMRSWIRTEQPGLRHSKSSARSSAFAECVSAPTEIQSTPVSAIARTV